MEVMWLGADNHNIIREFLQIPFVLMKIIRKSDNLLYTMTACGIKKTERIGRFTTCHLKS